MSKPKKGGATSKHTGRERLVASAAMLLSVVFAIAVFLILDGLYTTWITRKHVSYNTCKVRDPIRHHAFEANCAAVQHWGADSYDFFTNNLGFRDERIRDVPPADARPRVLLLGDSFTEAPLAWKDSYVGRVAAHFPQYDFLNGGVGSYSPSNYLNTARMVLDKGIEFDEVIVFIDISDVQDEAAYYKDGDTSGSVIVDDKHQQWSMSTYAKWRSRISTHFLLTNYMFEHVEQYLVDRGFYHLVRGWFGDTFDMERAAWTYRPVDEKDRYTLGYAPLGVEGGIAKEEAKMTLLWQELTKRNIPISVVVDPWPAQLVHDTADSRQVRMWREWCDGKCLRFISVFPAFFAAKEQCPPSRRGCWYQNLFVFGDTHYNAGGNALVADAVIKSLTEVPPMKRSLRVSAVRDPGK
jgi:hypothetical protein